MDSIVPCNTRPSFFLGSYFCYDNPAALQTQVKQVRIVHFLFVHVEAGLAAETSAVKVPEVCTEFILSSLATAETRGIQLK